MGRVASTVAVPVPLRFDRARLMPSFRATLGISGMRPGHQPPDVLEVAAAAVPAPANVEARAIDIVRGVPVVVIRFAVPPLGDEDERAHAIAVAHAIRAAVDAVAVPAGLTVTKRVGGKWLPA